MDDQVDQIDESVKKEAEVSDKEQTSCDSTLTPEEMKKYKNMLRKQEEGWAAQPKFVPDEGDEDFIKVYGDEEEKADKEWRTKFWEVGDNVWEMTRSKSFNLCPNDSEVFTTKTMLNILFGSIKVTYSTLLPVVSEVTKIFKANGTTTIVIEARKHRPVTVTQHVGIRTGFADFSALERDPVPTVLPGDIREVKTVSVVRIGWLKEEYGD